MNKYRLLKDLPELEKGTILEITKHQEGHLYANTPLGNGGSISMDPFPYYPEEHQEWFEEIKDEVPKSWDDLFRVSGYSITQDSAIRSYVGYMTNDLNKNIFKTKAQAESALAMAQLSQLMAHPSYNGDWVPDWRDENTKPSIEHINGCISKYYSISRALFLAFETAEIRDKFLEDHRELIETYFSIFETNKS